MQDLTPAIANELREAMLLARRGSVAAARQRAEAALARSGGHGALHAFLGMLCCQSGDMAAAVPHLRRALRANPDDLTIAANLSAALIAIGDAQGAAPICSEERAKRDASGRLWRLRGYLLLQSGESEAAAGAYERVVARHPQDFESWNNLGNARTAAGDVEGAIEALGRAATLAPANGPVQLNLAASLTNAGRFAEAAALLTRYTDAAPADSEALERLAYLLRHLYRDAEALGVLERAARAAPRNADLRVQLGEERAAAWQFEGAEQAFREALAIAPAHSRAHVQLALVLEHLNREEELPQLLATAETAGVEAGAVNFIRALVLRRERRFAEGLEVLGAVPPELEPIRQAQLEGQFRDRLGDADGAFSAFSEMNRLFALDPSDPLRRAAQYRAALAADREVVTPEWIASWRRVAPPSSPPAPVFLVGFPRSGTTLLDTMLMGHPDVQVLEERPPLQHVEDRLGGLANLASLDGDALAALRNFYFEEVGQWTELRPNALLVDKSPLHMNKVPLIHRLFPHARFILALRHPCDVVLSCFITSFRPNNAMANFLDLETSARFYDESFGYWEQCRSLFPIEVHTVAYERMIEDAAGELQPLFRYLRLEWREEVLDHRRTAAARGLISTASYSQVTEPIYRRSAGRWERYRQHLAPVLPILAPWAERMGYSIKP